MFQNLRNTSVIVSCVLQIFSLLTVITKPGESCSRFKLTYFFKEENIFKSLKFFESFYQELKSYVSKV